MVTFAIAHLSVIVLRYREADRPSAFRVPLSVKFGRGSVPLPAALGALLLDRSRWVSVIVLHEGARIVGGAWMLAGIAMYVIYRSTQGKALTKRFTIPRRGAPGGRARRVRQHPRAGLRRAARRRHHRHRRPARRRARRRGRGRRGRRGAVRLRDPDVAADRRARAGRAGQEGEAGAGAGEGGRRGVRRGGGGDRDGARAHGRAGDRGGGCAGGAWRRSCWRRRSPAACAAGRILGGRGRSATASWGRPRATWSRRRPAR